MIIILKENAVANADYVIRPEIFGVLKT